MDEVSIVGVDLAKQVFQLHGAGPDGRVIFRKKLSRPQFSKFMASLPPCVVAMEACGTAHYWGRQMAVYGHDVRLIPPIYVKPFVKRQKNDMADAEAIAEAALRPTMRTVPVKTAEQQSRAMLFRTRGLLVNQRTQLVNALRGHLAEHGVIVAKGLGNLERLAAVIRDEATALPDLVRDLGAVFLGQIEQASAQIVALERRIAVAARDSDVVRRLQQMPGIGPICAMAVETFAPAVQTFERARDFAAWLGLVPRQHSSGGKQRLGRTSKMGQRDIHRLLIVGAMSVVHWKGRGGASTLNLLNLFFGLGGLLTPLIAGSLLAGNAVRLCYLVAGLTAVTLFVHIWTAMPPPSGERGFKVGEMGSVLGNPALPLLSFFLFLYVACEVGVWNWLVKHLVSQGIAESQALTILSLGFALGMLIGRLAVSRLLIRISALNVTLAAAILMTVTTWLMLQTSDPSAAWVLVFCAGVAMAPAFPTTLAMAADAFPKTPATAMGIVITSGWIGLAVSSKIVGGIAGGDDARLKTALLVLPGFSLLMVLVNLVLRPVMVKTCESASPNARP